MFCLFKGYVEEDVMFATIEKGRRFYFTGQGHDMFDDGGEARECSIVEIGLVFVSEIEMCCRMTFGFCLDS